MIVSIALSRAGRTDGEAAVLEFQLLDGEFGGRASGPGGFRLCLRLGGGATQRGVVPLARCVAEKSDFGILDGDAGDVEGPGKNEREEFDADVEGFGREERRRTEFGIVADGKIFGGKGAADEREAEIAELYFAAKRFGCFFLDGGTKLIDRDEKRRGENKHNQNSDDDEDGAKRATHAHLPHAGVADRFVPPPDTIPP